MAYDSKTYGQSPFGAPKKPDGAKGNDVPAKETPLKNAASTSPVVRPSSETMRKATVMDDGLDQGPEQVSLLGAFPETEASPTNTTNKWIDKLSLGKSAADSFVEGIMSPAAEPKKTSRAANKSATGRAGTRKTAAKSGSKSKSTRKSKKAKAAEVARAEADAAEAAVAQRFREEDQSAYLSLVYKTGISALVWAVLMLLRHELSDDAIAIINIIIHPLLIATEVCLNLKQALAQTGPTK